MKKFIVDMTNLGARINIRKKLNGNLVIEVSKHYDVIIAETLEIAPEALVDCDIFLNKCSEKISTKFKEYEATIV